MYFVYIIFSERLNRYYVGTTDDVGERLVEHNSNFYKNSFTSKGIPWDLRLKTNPISSERAYRLERFIKSMKSKKFKEKLMASPEMLDDIISKLD